MQSMRSLVKITIVVFSLLASLSAFADVVVLETAKLCSLTIRGSNIKGATLVGHRPALVEFLSNYSEIRIHDCSFLLSDHAANESEAAWIVRIKATAAPPQYRDLPPNVILMSINDPVEFLSIYRPQPAPSSPSAPPKETTGETPPTEPKRSSTNVNSCSNEGEICISSTGEASMEIACGNATIRLSTHGEFNIGVKGESGEANLTIP